MDTAILWILRGALALLMASAALHKLREPAEFTETLRDYRVVPDRLVVFVAPAVIAFEVVLAVTLLVPGYFGNYFGNYATSAAAAAAAACAALLAIYSAAIAVNLARGRRDLDCGCFGPARRQPIRGWLLVRNGVFVAASLAATIPSTGRTLTLVDAVSITGALAVLVLLSATFDAFAVESSRVYTDGRRP